MLVNTDPDHKFTELALKYNHILQPTIQTASAEVRLYLAQY